MPRPRSNAFDLGNVDQADVVQALVALQQPVPRPLVWALPVSCNDRDQFKRYRFDDSEEPDSMHPPVLRTF